jgi:phosphate:Na+ symporter
MVTVIGTIIGGIGLFLLGMILMTDGLKALAGDALRSILARFTTNRFSAIGVGAGTTAVVQSSTATTMATIGFVSSGLLTFQNAIGVNMGAALGTTSTGWIVALLGLKLSIGSVMLPLIGFGALAKLLGRGRVSHIGIALAGFGTIFVGIDTLQLGMEGLAERFDPESFPQATITGRLVLVLIGVAMTVVMQSSSAAVATTLAALAGGTINLEQAACLVIGQNMGTAVTTAAIAGIGASTPGRRTALAHVIYNVSTGTIALIMLPLFLGLVEHATDNLILDDDALTIAAFHTVFNVVGVLVFLPLIPRMSRFVERVIKARGPRLTQHLDPSLVNLPPVAIEAARRVLKEVAAEMLALLSAHLKGSKKAPSLEDLEELKEALRETRRFLAKVPPPGTQGYEFHRQISTVHALDHLHRLANETWDIKRLQITREHSALRKNGEELAGLAASLVAQLRDPELQPDVEAAQEFSERLADERRTARPAILEATAARSIDPDTALGELAAQRWLDRLAYHVWRSMYHLREMTRKEHSEQEHHETDEAVEGENAGSPSESQKAQPASEDDQ